MRDDDDPGPIWEHLPMEDPSVPPRRTSVHGRVETGDVPRPALAWLQLRDLFSAPPLRFIAAFVVLAAAGQSNVWGRELELANAVVAELVWCAMWMVSGGASVIALVVIAGRERKAGAAWLHVLALGAAYGLSDLAFGALDRFGGSPLVAMIGGLLALFVGFFLVIAWAMAPLVAADRALWPVDAAFEAGPLMRGSVWSGCVVFLLLVTTSWITFGVLAAARGVDSVTSTGATPELAVMSASWAFAMTMWLSWVAARYRDATSGRCPEAG